MEQNGKTRKARIITFRKKRGPEHFSPVNSKILSDVDGSYTGTPVTESFDTDEEDLHPVQDADDL